MSLKQQLKDDLKIAMKKKELVKRDSIRAINTMIKQIEVDERKELNDEDILKLIQKGIKQREEAVSQYKNAKRDDLVQKEQEQINIFKEYMPKQLSDEELESRLKSLIEELGVTSIKDIGKIMGQASKKFAGVADGKRINEMTKSLLE